MDFPDYLKTRVQSALTAAADADASGVYAISLFVYDEEDDPMRPTLTVGWNTEERVHYAWTASPEDRRHVWWVPSDEAEARWNYAFWLQNALTVVGGQQDPMGAALCKEWLSARGLWVTEPEAPETYEVTDAATQALVDLCVRVARELHEAGVIKRLFGREVPVLVHELEYYQAIVDQAVDANPPGVAEDFVAWVTALA